MNKNIKYILIATLLIIESCNSNYDKLVKSMAPKNESTFAKNILEDLRKNDFIKIKPFLNAQLLTDDVDSKLLETAKYFPNGKLINIKIIGYNSFNSPNDHQALLTYEYQFSDGWVVASLALESENNSFVINRININRFKKSLEEINALTFKDKPIKYYIFILFGILILLFVIVTFIVCIKTKYLSKKWLWLIFILISIFGITLNWTTGNIGFKLIQFSILGVSLTASSPNSPWFLGLSLPVGAIVFWIKRKSLVSNPVKGIVNEDLEVLENGTWKCPKCNEENKNNVHKCSNCGYTLL